MSDDHAIIEAEAVEIVEVQRDEDMLHPMVRAMMSRPDFGTDEMGKLMELQERYEANQAKKAFQSARAALLSDLPATIKKNKHVSFNATRYSYADLPQVMRSVMPALERHGFAISWRNDGDGKTEAVTCVLSHRLGHSEENTRRCVVEQKKGMSPVQSAQATVTYLQRQALVAILGVVTDDTPDADERRPPPPEEIPIEERRRRAVLAIERAGRKIMDAVTHTGREPAQWTADDLAALRGWLQEEEAGS